MKLNTKQDKIYTHEGAIASHINPEQQLRRSVMCCLLWEDSFYEDGESIADRIINIIPKVDLFKVRDIAIEARNKMKLRHIPLLIAKVMAGLNTHKGLVSVLLENIIQRADELSEFLAIYWKDGKKPLSAQIKKGLASAFNKFNAYELAKYDKKDSKIKLRDVLFLCHAKPKNKEQELLWKKLIDGTLEPPETWEVLLSTGHDKKATWEKLIKENKLGGLALLRNLRNMQDAHVDDNIIIKGIENIKTERILPFRFISASKYAPQLESYIEKSMMKCLQEKEKLSGKTVLLIDVSGSMDAPISGKSNLMRYDCANGLAILLREICERVSIYSFSNDCIRIPDRHGFALRDAITSSQSHSGTDTGKAVNEINNLEQYNRLIILTDEQSHTSIPEPPCNSKSYIINVASYQNGIGYATYTHINGWSESVIDYILNCENSLN